MRRTIKAYLPRWVLAVVGPMLLIVWGLITYLAFVDPGGKNEIGVVGWLAITAVLALVGGMMWAMASRRLPAYVLEIEEEDN